MNKIYTIIWFITFFILAMFINICITLRQYGLAYEDSQDLNIMGENFVINAIYNDIYSEDWSEYRQAIEF